MSTRAGSAAPEAPLGWAWGLETVWGGADRAWVGAVGVAGPQPATRSDSIVTVLIDRSAVRMAMSPFWSSRSCQICAAEAALGQSGEGPVTPHGVEDLIECGEEAIGVGFGPHRPADDDRSRLGVRTTDHAN